ncbi:MAG: DUF4087 domain-containing protein [Cyanobacteria bacterium J06632_22]
MSLHHCQGNTSKPTSTTGYYCGCLDVVVNPETMYVEAIYAGEALPLATCNTDPALDERAYSLE